jgi:hypothetical protein
MNSSTWKPMFLEQDLFCQQTRLIPDVKHRHRRLNALSIRDFVVTMQLIVVSNKWLDPLIVLVGMLRCRFFGRRSLRLDGEFLCAKIISFMRSLTMHDWVGSSESQPLRRDQLRENVFQKSMRLPFCRTYSMV